MLRLPPDELDASDIDVLCATSISASSSSSGTSAQRDGHAESRGVFALDGNTSISVIDYFSSYQPARRAISYAQAAALLIGSSLSFASAFDFGVSMADFGVSIVA